MKKILMIIVVYLSIFLCRMGGYAYAMSSGVQTTVIWMKCCEKQATGKNCSDSKNLAECYAACQRGCGDPDDLAGKKCRQQCNINIRINDYACTI